MAWKKESSLKSTLIKLLIKTGWEKEYSRNNVLIKMGLKKEDDLRGPAAAVKRSGVLQRRLRRRPSRLREQLKRGAAFHSGKSFPCQS